MPLEQASESHEGDSDTDPEGGSGPSSPGAGASEDLGVSKTCGEQVPLRDRSQQPIRDSFFILGSL